MLVFRRALYYILFFFASHVAAEKIHFSKWIKASNSGAVYHFETLLKTGIKDCIDTCKTKKKCKYINYDKGANACTFVGTEAGNEVHLTVESRKGFIFGNKSEWNMDQYKACDECENHGVCGKEKTSNYTNCQSSGCGPPTEKPYVVVYGNMFSIGDTVKYECDDGYELIINADFNSSTIQQQFPEKPYLTAVCQEDGNWSFPEFQCIPKCSAITGNNAGLVNRARGKQVTLSSQYDGDSPGKLMVDGNLSNVWPCACTAREHFPWAIIDLERSYTIHSIYVINRAHCCPERLHSVRIQVGDDRARLNYVAYRDQAIGADFTFVLAAGITGRYVKIKIEALQYLTICELEVCTAR